MSSLTARLRGLAALVVILAVVAGMPAVLLAIGANPLPEAVPSWEQLRALATTPDDGTAALAAVTVVAWAAWAVVSVAIFAEAAAALRGVRSPRLPGLALPQGLALKLVTMAALAFVAAPVTAQAGPLSPVPASVATTSATTTALAVEADQRSPAVPRTHTVAEGESLWSIAAEHLGAGERYEEIVALNAGIVDGTPSLIRPGWTLTLPSPPSPRAASAIEVEPGDTLRAIAAERLGDPALWPQIAAASADITQPDGARLSDPDVIDVGWTLRIPASPAVAQKAAPVPAAESPAPAPDEGVTATPPPSPAPPATATPPATEAPAQPSADPAAPSATPAPPKVEEAPAPAEATPRKSAPATASASAEQEESAWPAATTYGVGGVLAAGLIALLARRRRTQQRRRRPGQKIPLPHGASADVEHDLRVVADPLSVEVVGAALRSLAYRCTAEERPLPRVRAAHLSAEAFELYLAEPTDLPAPWTGNEDASVWTLTREFSTDLDVESLPEVPAPYPTLVTIGHDDDGGHVLVDLEYVGALGVLGGDEAVREVLAALTMELATSVWADDLQITLVGAFPELDDALHTGRIRYRPSVGRTLEDLTARAVRDRAEMTSEAATSLRAARPRGISPETWTPEIVVLAGPLTEAHREQVHSYLDVASGTATAVVTAGVSLGDWALDLTAGENAGDAVLTPVGVTLRPQRLPTEQYAHVLQVASLSDPENLTTTPRAPEADTADHLEPHAPARAERARMLEASAASAAPATSEPFTVHAVATSPSPSGISAATLELNDVASTTEPPVEEVDGADTTWANTTPDDASPAPLGDDTINDQKSSERPGDQLPAPVLAAAPRITVLGPVEITGATTLIESSKRTRLLEQATFIALNPGSSTARLDEAIWPNRGGEDNLNTRNTATSKLRRWMGTAQDGRTYLPAFEASIGYRFDPAVRTDVDDWRDLLPDGPLSASTDHLEKALKLVRGRPFQGHHRRYYAWAEPLTQELISDIVDASYELARRALMESRWRAAEHALVIGLSIEPGQERLWRMRILAAHESHNPEATTEAIDRLLTVTEQLECDLEPETTALLEALEASQAGFDELMATAL